MVHECLADRGNVLGGDRVSEDDDSVRGACATSFEFVVNVEGDGHLAAGEFIGQRLTHRLGTAGDDADVRGEVERASEVCLFNIQELDSVVGEDAEEIRGDSGGVRTGDGDNAGESPGARLTVR